MNDFIHVDCPITRGVLEGRNVPYPVILRAARFSEACQSEDYKSRHLTDCVFAARQNAIADMWQALSAGNETAAVNAMRKFWSV
jgi:hypothetical protein